MKVATPSSAAIGATLNGSTQGARLTMTRANQIATLAFRWRLLPNRKTCMKPGIFCVGPGEQRVGSMFDNLLHFAVPNREFGRRDFKLEGAGLAWLKQDFGEASEATYRSRGGTRFLVGIDLHDLFSRRRAGVSNIDAHSYDRRRFNDWSEYLQMGNLKGGVAEAKSERPQSIGGREDVVTTGAVRRSWFVVVASAAWLVVVNCGDVASILGYRYGKVAAWVGLPEEDVGNCFAPLLTGVEGEHNRVGMCFDPRHAIGSTIHHYNNRRLACLDHGSDEVALDSRRSKF